MGHIQDEVQSTAQQVGGGANRPQEAKGCQPS
jgi:hypothetical protein